MGLQMVIFIKDNKSINFTEHGSNHSNYHISKFHLNLKQKKKKKICLTHES